MSGKRLESVRLSGQSVWAGIAAWLIATQAAWGCPFCQSEIGQQVQANIFNVDFGSNLLLLAAPMLLLWGGLYLLSMAGRAPMAQATEQASGDRQ